MNSLKKRVFWSSWLSYVTLVGVLVLILDVVLVLILVVVVQGRRFLQLKNPWSHLRWKGRFSERDEKNWTPELLKYLNFDPKTAQKFDNGMKIYTFMSTTH